MNRLTVPRNENGPACVPDDDAISCYDEFGARDWIGPAIDRLAAYEDTGLTPAEVEVLKADNEQLRSERFWNAANAQYRLLKAYAIIHPDTPKKGVKQ